VQFGKDEMDETCTLVGAPFSHNSVGNVPVIEVPSIYKRCKDSIFPYSIGTVPFKCELEATDKVANSGKPASTLGRVPVRLLPFNQRICNFVQFPNVAGIDPLSLPLCNMNAAASTRL
jgi:hypothetical protein